MQRIEFGRSEIVPIKWSLGERIFVVPTATESLTKGQIMDFCSTCDFLSKRGVCRRSSEDQAKAAFFDLCTDARVDGQYGLKSKGDFIAIPRILILLARL